MTVQQPYGTPGLPVDITGSYPALAGYVPIQTGRRVAVALVDGLIVALVDAGVIAVALALGGGSLRSNSGSGYSAGSAAVSLGGSLVILMLLLLELWALFFRSARLSGVLMKATYVDVLTGRRTGGKAFLKFLLQGALGAVSFGLAPLIMVFSTITEPLKRNWFDRTAGVMLVDHRTGRSPDQPPPIRPAAVPPPAISDVQFPWATMEAGAPTGSVPAPPYPWQQAPAASVNPILQADGLITSTPHSAHAPSAAPPPAAPSFAPPVIREMRSVDAAIADKTMLAADSVLQPGGSGPRVTLDGGAVLSLTPPSVVGRNPSAPGSHPDAVAHLVEDPLTSKTHLLLGQDDQGAWVIDLRSTNGVRVARTASGVPTKIEPGRRVHLPAGSKVLFGHRTITVDGPDGRG